MADKKYASIEITECEEGINIKRTGKAYIIMGLLKEAMLMLEYEALQENIKLNKQPNT